MAVFGSGGKACTTKLNDRKAARRPPALGGGVAAAGSNVRREAGERRRETLRNGGDQAFSGKRIVSGVMRVAHNGRHRLYGRRADVK